MKSHIYQLHFREVVQYVVGPLLPLVALGAVMALLAQARLLPDPKPILDMERTIITHQVEAALSAHPADVILLGDSSCMMNISAPALQEALPGNPPVLNLGTLSYLGLDAYKELLAAALRNRKPPALVVLLMHPEALRLGESNPYYSEFLTSALEKRVMADPRRSRIYQLAGTDALQARFLSRILPSPLQGEWALHFGFTTDLWHHLDDHQGSAVDPGRFDPAQARGNAEYRLAQSIKAASQQFRAALPDGTQLAVGITPSPKGFVLPSHDALCEAMLRQWSEWLRADLTLTHLPCSLPDEYFASNTHLTPAAAADYTKLLADALAGARSPSESPRP